MDELTFLRYLIQLIDAKKSEPAPTVVINIDNKGTVTSDNKEEVETALDKDDVFIPPLQAKIEMMKKMTNTEPKNQELLSTEEDEPFEQ